MMPRPVTLTVACSLVLTFCGCSSENKPTPENFTRVLNAWFQDHSDCLFPHGRQFPYEVAPSPTATQQKRRMDALMDAGLMVRLEDRDMHVDRYTLKPAGERFAPKFCYGHRTVTSIESFTPPGPRNGFTETTVTYRYRLQDVPMWAKTEEVQSAFPAVGSALSGSATAQETLATVGAGWQVPH